MHTVELIEIKKDSTYTFTYFKEEKNILIIPSTAKITIKDSAGNEILAQSDMVITNGICTYAWDSTGNDVGLNYQVIYDIDSDNSVLRLFDIYLYPFVNDITDSDLIAVDESIKTAHWEKSGKADSGTTTTLVDESLKLSNDDDYNGGRIELYKGQSYTVHEVTDFVKSTGTITFTPPADTITDETYLLRKSYQEKINTAGNDVKLDFKRINKRASLILDSYTCKTLIIYKFFENYYLNMIKEQGDEYHLKHEKYAKKYRSEMESVSLVYDVNMDGDTDEGEDNTKVGAITWER